MNSNQKKWPNNWDYHISKSFELYFWDKEIEYLDKNFWAEEIRTTLPSEVKVSSMSLRFQIGSHNYMVSLCQNDPHFSCNVFFKKIFAVPSELEVDNVFICMAGVDIAVLEDVAGIGGPELNPNSSIEFVESAITMDHERRNGNNDYANDEEENDTMEQFSPCEIVEPELTLV